MLGGGASNQIKLERIPHMNNTLFNHNFALESSLNNMTDKPNVPELLPLKKDQRLRLRACNKENYRDVIAVLELFQAQYGGSHPLSKVLTDSFWKDPEDHLAGEEFLSLIIEDLDLKKPVAHIGLAFREEDQHVEILLPAIHPEHRDSLDTFFNLFTEKVADIVARKKWERLLFLCSTADPFLQLIAHTYLNAKATAFINSGISCTATSHLDDILLKMDKPTKAPYILLSSSITGSKVVGPIYIPNSLKRFINIRARLMKISFTLGEGQGISSPLSHPLKNKNLNKYNRSRFLQLSNRPLYGINILDCYPSSSEVINEKLVQAIGRLKRVSKNCLSLRVCLNSHLAPQFIQLTKELGFIPSGIDIKSNRLFLILSVLNKELMYNITLHSRESKALREDILSRRWTE